MLLVQDLVPAPGSWSPDLSALWSAALSAQSGEDRIGDRRIVRVHAGSTITSTAIAGITPADGITTKPTRLFRAKLTSTIWHSRRPRFSRIWGDRSCSVSSGRHLFF